MSALKPDVVASLKSYLARIDDLEDERADLGDDIRQLYAAAKAEGFAPKAIRTMVKRRRAKNPTQLADDETVLETYMHAVGMLPEPALHEQVAALVKDGLARDQVIAALQTIVPEYGEIIARIGGKPMRIWRDETGTAYAAEHIEPVPERIRKATTGKASATVLSIVPTDPIKAAADRAERRARRDKLADEASSDATDAPEDEPIQ